jgi:ribulose 1,5-bisphosphate carboxylase large subunit-like protein
MVLGTGHGNLKEIKCLVDTALALGVKRILVNHPHYNVNASLEDMKSWAERGAYIEVNACVFKGASKFGVIDMDYAEKMIRTCGVEQIIIDSDLGQFGNVDPVDGLYDFIETLMNDFNITEEEINIMTKVNPAKLLNL